MASNGVGFHKLAFIIQLARIKLAPPKKRPSGLMANVFRIFFFV